MNTFTIIVPASSANLGTCFDSGGVAVSRYLTVKVTKQDKWEIIHHSAELPDFDDYATHYIYQMAQHVATSYNKELPTCRLDITSEIPLARGLGSSSSAVLAGIELANQLLNLGLTDQEKLEIGTQIEGHPDNIAPALLGGIVISTTNSEKGTTSLKLPLSQMDFVVYIPTFEIKTEMARQALPDTYSRHKATTASATSNVMIAALASGNHQLAGDMMEQDVFHEPYRSRLIPEYVDIRNAAKTIGAYGTVISGSGPTLISFIPQGAGDTITKELAPVFPEYHISPLSMDTGGLVVR